MQPLGKFVAFAPPLVGEEEIAEVADTLRSGWLTTGPKTERFEAALAAYMGAAGGLAVNSCTSALHLSAWAAGLGPGQGAITTPLTFASTAHAIMYQGARPYFADIEGDTGNLDPAAARRFLEEECRPGPGGRRVHKATGDAITALAPVHYGGHPVDLASFWRLAADYKLNMIEDAAHALGAFYDGRPIGHPGLVPPAAQGLAGLTAFSFYATKNITTGEGGFLTTPDGALLQKCRVMSMYGISDSRRIWDRYAPKGTWVYDVAGLGFKYNMMDIQAAIGLHQLEKLPWFIKRRAENAAIYNEALKGLGDLVDLPAVRPYARPAWHLYPLRLRLGALDIGRDGFIEELRSLNVGSSVLFIPLHMHSFYRGRLGYGEGAFPKAEGFFRGLVNLPVSPAHSAGTIGQAAEVVAGLLRAHRR